MNAIAASLSTEPLWSRARAMFARALAAIGDAASVARLTSLTPMLRRRIVAWLAPLEHVVRKLLLAEAAALKRAQDRSAGPLARNGAGVASRSAALRAACAAGLPAEASAKAGAARSNLDPAAPETWSATFSLAPPRDPLAVPDSRAPRIRALWGETKKSDTHAPTRAAKQAPAPPTGVCHSLALARRFEALRRVLEDPLPHARRLARLLARAVRRFPEIARRYLFAPARTGDYDKEDPRLSIDSLGAAFDAPDAFTDSS